MQFLLHCQSFIELVRAGKLHDALTFAQGHLSRYRSRMEGRYPGLLAEVIALLAHADPDDDHPLLGSRQREIVADALNSAVRKSQQQHVTTNSTIARANQNTRAFLVWQVLEERGAPPSSAIERLLRQLVATRRAMVEANGSFGQHFSIAVPHSDV